MHSREPRRIYRLVFALPTTVSVDLVVVVVAVPSSVRNLSGEAARRDGDCLHFCRVYLCTVVYNRIGCLHLADIYMKNNSLSLLLFALRVYIPLVWSSLILRLKWPNITDGAHTKFRHRRRSAEDQKVGDVGGQRAEWGRRV